MTTTREPCPRCGAPSTHRVVAVPYPGGELEFPFVGCGRDSKEQAFAINRENAESGSTGCAGVEQLDEAAARLAPELGRRRKGKKR